MTGEAPAPLIVTAALPSALHARFTALRRAHFPPERNYLEAHVTLFHALPAMVEPELRRVLSRLAGGNEPPQADVSGIVSLGRGTAIALRSPRLLELRARIAEHFHGMLTAQDSHPPRLHVTIQNKVSPAEAKALHAALEGTIQPERFAFGALSLHAYRGGPWQHLRDFAFRR